MAMILNVPPSPRKWTKSKTGFVVWKRNGDFICGSMRINKICYLMKKAEEEYTKVQTKGYEGRQLQPVK
ncbi:hypothetical protein CHS0354_041227 [Potamilus streckersoni]|uniref:Uncharacterized protein n=1 Tax=Potamilus streckersoni TaxID=2493646 RepID=A0AAE0VTL7_9BIVA|nr:hypothetical protein CHS0354_041227 [Potamilus streckersoni]